MPSMGESYTCLNMLQGCTLYHSVHACGTLCGNSFFLCGNSCVGVYQRPITACGLFMHNVCSGYFHSRRRRRNGVRGVCIVDALGIRTQHADCLCTMHAVGISIAGDVGVCMVDALIIRKERAHC